MRVRKKGSFFRTLTQNSEGSDQARLEQELQTLNILPPYGEVLEYEELLEWGRRGAETYTAAAHVRFLSQDVEHDLRFLSKAFLSSAMPIDERLNILLARREDLCSLGIHVPDLYSSGGGCLHEAFIPFSLLETFTPHDTDLLDRLAFIAATLDMNHYHPMDFPGDIRTDGASLFYVDFGSDLGGRMATPSAQAKAQLLRLYGPRQAEADECYALHVLRRARGETPALHP